MASSPNVQVRSMAATYTLLMCRKKRDTGSLLLVATVNDGGVCCCPTVHFRGPSNNDDDDDVCPRDCSSMWLALNRCYSLAHPPTHSLTH